MKALLLTSVIALLALIVLDSRTRSWELASP